MTILKYGGYIFMQNRRLNTALCCSSLAIGGTIYIVCKPDSHISNLFDNVYIIEILRDSFSKINCSILYFYVPDFLWGFSLTCGLVAILTNKYIDIFICGFIALICGVIWEVLQYFNIASGTFDFLDILMYLSAAIVVVIFNLRSFKK